MHRECARLERPLDVDTRIPERRADLLGVVLVGDIDAPLAALQAVFDVRNHRRELFRLRLVDEGEMIVRVVLGYRFDGPGELGRLLERLETGLESEKVVGTLYLLAHSVYRTVIGRPAAPLESRIVAVRTAAAGLRSKL